jgi:hypothetical protein
MSEIVNKVAASGLITIDLETMYPQGHRSLIDIKDQLWMELALKEKDFRDWIKTNDWEKYRNHYVAITCSNDAIVPHWAYMLVASALTGVASKIVFGSLQQLEDLIFSEIINSMNTEDFRDKRIVIKGCSELPVPVSAYLNLVTALQPLAKSIMFGEPCSTVPVYKKQG